MFEIGFWTSVSSRDKGMSSQGPALFVRNLRGVFFRCLRPFPVLRGVAHGLFGLGFCPFPSVVCIQHQKNGAAPFWRSERHNIVWRIPNLRANRREYLPRSGSQNHWLPTPEPGRVNEGFGLVGPHFIVVKYLLLRSAEMFEHQEYRHLP